MDSEIVLVHNPSNRSSRETGETTSCLSKRKQSYQGDEGIEEYPLLASKRACHEFPSSPLYGMHSTDARSEQDFMRSMDNTVIDNSPRNKDYEKIKPGSKIRTGLVTRTHSPKITVSLLVTSLSSWVWNFLG